MKWLKILIVLELFLRPNINEEKFKTRDDVYDLSLSYDAATPDSLISFAEGCCPLQWLIEKHYTEYREDPVHPKRLKSMPGDPELGWIDWLTGIDKKTFSSLRKRIKQWLSEEPDWDERDYIHYTKFNEGAVFDYFAYEHPEVLDALDIYIIDGPYPGSNYRGAELGMPIDQANAIAEEMGLTFRFRKAKEEFTETIADESAALCENDGEDSDR